MKKFIYLIVAICLALFFFKVTTSYRMPADYNYDSDFGRDLWMMEKIIHGKQTLVGPQFSFSGLRLAPYHFYLFAPVLAFFNSYQAVVYFNALLFLLAIVATYLIIRLNYGSFYSFLGIVWLATTPYIILAGRSPGNAFTYLAFYMVYLAYIFAARSISVWAALGLGIISGVMVNYHPISILVVIAPFVVREIIVRDKWFRKILSYAFAYFAGFAATFLPVLAFELKHGFVLTKTFFGPKNGEFMTPQYIGSIGKVAHMVQLNDASFTWVPVTGMTIVALIVMSYFERRNPPLKKWFITVVIVTSTFLIFGRDVPHYFFPVLLFLQLMLIFFLKELRNPKLIMAILVFINLIFFPVRFYKTSRNLRDIESNFRQAVKEINIPKSDINTVVINETRLSAPAYEYRYLLTKLGFQVEDEYSYNTSGYLLMVSEIGETDWKKISTWETSQFGDKKLLKELKTSKTVYYLFAKNNK